MTESVFTDQFSDLLDHCNSLPGDLCVLGDFNFHFDLPHNPTTTKLLDLLRMLSLHQTAKQSTHRQGHIIDWVTERPDDGDWVIERPDDGDWVIERPDDGDWVIERSDDGDWVIERPDGGDWVVQRPDDGDWVIERPDDGDWVIERSDDGDWVIERSDDGDWVIERPDDGDWVIERPDDGVLKSTVVSSTLESDHKCVITRFEVNISPPPPVFRHVRNLRAIDCTVFRHDLHSELSRLEHPSTEQSNAALQSVLDKHAPASKRKVSAESTLPCSVW